MSMYVDVENRTYNHISFVTRLELWGSLYRWDFLQEWSGRHTEEGHENKNAYKLASKDRQ